MTFGTSALAAALLSIGVFHGGCSSTSAGSSNPGAAASGLVLRGVYAVNQSDGGSGSDPLTVSGDVLRFEGDRFSIHHVPCPSPGFATDAALPDLSIADGCTSFGTFAISADGSTLSMTDDATGKTSTQRFTALAAIPLAGDAGGPIGLSGGLHLLGSGNGGGYEVRVDQRRQFNQPDPVGIAIEQTGGDLESKAGLAAATGSG